MEEQGFWTAYMRWLLGPERAKATPVPPRPVVFWVVTVLGLVAAMAAMFVFLQAVREIYLEIIAPAGAEDPSARLRNIALVLAATFGTPFVIWRSIVAQQQATTAAKNLDLSEKRLATEQFTKAVELLGETREGKDGKREPAMELRLGAIYTLERIARETPDLHIQIIEVLCAYLRENQSARDLKDWPGAVVNRLRRTNHEITAEEIEAHPDFKAASDEDRFIGAARILSNRKYAFWDWTRRAEALREDLQTVLDVIGRLTQSQPDVEADVPYCPNLATFALRFCCYHGEGLRGADLSWGRMEGANLSRARMEHANLYCARMEGADLSGAWLNRARLFGARMEGANLAGAQMEHADLCGAEMDGANLANVRMAHAYLYEAEMAGANLSWARMEGANLSGVDLAHATLNWARMEGVDLMEARMESVKLIGARIERVFFLDTWLDGADLSFSIIIGAPEKPLLAEETSFDSAINNGGALRFVDLTDAMFNGATDFRNSFGDGSVILPEGFARPRQWGREDEVFSDEEFWGRWRGWLEAGPDSRDWTLLAPEGFEDVTPIPPPEGCVWQTEPLQPETHPG